MAAVDTVAWVRSPQGMGYPPGYDRERENLAEAFANAVLEDAFFRMMEQPTATWEYLDELACYSVKALLPDVIGFFVLLPRVE